MKNNQNDVSKRLDRDEFIRYIETLTLDQIIDLMPYEIYYKTEFDDINLPKQTSFGCHKKHIKIQLDYNISEWVFSIFYDKDTDRIRQKPIKFKSILPKHAVKKMIYYLYDNWYLPQYSAS